MKKATILCLVLLLCAGLLFGCANQTENTTGDESTNQTGEETQNNTQTTIDPDKKALLVVSFGTSYADTREKTIDATEAAIHEAFPGYDLKRAFTSQTIIDILAERDKVQINNVTQAMDELLAEGYGDIIVQPLHVMNGEEYDGMMADIEPYEESFANIVIGKPLLSSYEDYQKVVAAVAAEFPEMGDKDVMVLMGHGTEHFANSAYGCLDYIFKDEGYENVYVGTVEGFPTFDTIVKKLSVLNVEKVYLMPLMVVAGDHAQNDMAGDEADSWKSMLKAKGYEVEPILKGLGEMKGIQEMYIEHIQDAINGQEAAE